MRILHTAETLSINGAGIFYYLNDLTDWQSKRADDITVASLLDEASQRDAHLWKNVKTELMRAHGPRVFPISFAYRDTLARLRPDIVHCHGLWTYHSLAVPGYCRATGTPYIVSPHGMLEPWAWRHHSWKKRPIWFLWEKRFLHFASALHATADMEANYLRCHGQQNPIAVIPVGVELKLPHQVYSRQENRQKTALFLSRIHPKKGLLDLVQAWSVVRPAGWKVVVAGPDSGDHLAVVQQAVHKANLDSSFEFPGPVYDSEKWALFQSADLFVLPTYSENFGIVIAEALAAGTPVITTRETPWKELVEHKCGWWIEVGAAPLAVALRDAVSLSDNERAEMGQRGRKLIGENYSWNLISQKMSAFYNWVLGRGPKPDCIYPS